MARKLKTYVTNLGFFELAVAAPSMKAALEAWGLSHNIFQHGFAKQTEDSKTVAAALAKPGVVLRWPVGTKDAFKEDADTPQPLPKAKTAPPKAVSKKSTKVAKRAPAKDRAAIIWLEKERKRRNRQRASEEAAEQRDQEKRDRAIEKAEAALKTARQHHEDALAELSSAREKLDRREQIQKERWDVQREKLEEAVERAKES